MLDKAESCGRVEDGVDVFRGDWVQSVWTRLDNKSSWTLRVVKKASIAVRFNKGRLTGSLCSEREREQCSTSEGMVCIDDDAPGIEVR